MLLPFRVLILGASSAMPAFGRLPSAQAVVHNERVFLIDCGEGTQFQLLRYKVKLARLDAIFISHLHGDHVLGLIGLLTTLSLCNRQKPLTLVGPEGLKKYIEVQLALTQSVLLYPLELLEISEGTELALVFENNSLTVSAFPLRHRIPTFGYRIDEKPKRRPFLFYEAKAAEIPSEYFALIKNEIDITLQDGSRLTSNDFLGERPPSYSYAYCSDTRYFMELADVVKGVTQLYHEATFLHENIARAEETFHSTALEAASIAQKAGVQRLLIGHFSARYRTLSPHLMEARAIFPNTQLALEGKVFALPQNTVNERAFEATLLRRGEPSEEDAEPQEQEA